MRGTKHKSHYRFICGCEVTPNQQHQNFLPLWIFCEVTCLADPKIKLNREHVSPKTLDPKLFMTDADLTTSMDCSDFGCVQYVRSIYFFYTSKLHSMNCGHFKCMNRVIHHLKRALWRLRWRAYTCSPCLSAEEKRTDWISELFYEPVHQANTREGRKYFFTWMEDFLTTHSRSE